jgi:hypothetical protein
VCNYDYQGDILLLTKIVLISGTIWEALVLFLAIWIAVKHFRELRKPGTPTGSIIFTVLIESHILYFGR